MELRRTINRSTSVKTIATTRASRETMKSVRQGRRVRQSEKEGSWEPHHVKSPAVGTLGRRCLFKAKPLAAPSLGGRADPDGRSQAPAVEEQPPLCCDIIYAIRVRPRLSCPCDWGWQWPGESRRIRPHLGCLQFATPRSSTWLASRACSVIGSGIAPS